MSAVSSRKILITGASSGLGFALARRFLAEGAEVWATSRDGMRLPSGAHTVALDLASKDSIRLFLARIGESGHCFDVVVNNAGSGAFFPVEAFSQEDFDCQFAVLLGGPVAISRHFYAKFLHEGRGTLVNVTSLSGTFPIPYMSAYSGAKAGLSAFTRTLMLESTGRGVVVIDFQPGDLATGFNESMVGFKLAELPAARRAAAACERHVNAGASPEKAAADLMRAIARGRSGVVITGTFWQARLGPLLARFAPTGVIRRYLLNYYDIR